MSDGPNACAKLERESKEKEEASIKMDKEFTHRVRHDAMGRSVLSKLVALHKLIHTLEEEDEKYADNR